MVKGKKLDFDTLRQAANREEFCQNRSVIETDNSILVTDMGLLDKNDIHGLPIVVDGRQCFFGGDTPFHTIQALVLAVDSPKFKVPEEHVQSVIDSILEFALDTLDEITPDAKN